MADFIGVRIGFKPAKEHVEAVMSVLEKPIVREPVLEKCTGCNHITKDGDAEFCSVYTVPAWKWEIGQCNFGTHIVREAKKSAFINPLKLAKMRARGQI
ncbi:MAG: hypothetical protein ACI9WU_001233 [Myxococcota bacterium]